MQNQEDRNGRTGDRLPKSLCFDRQTPTRENKQSRDHKASQQDQDAEHGPASPQDLTKGKIPLPNLLKMLSSGKKKKNPHLKKGAKTCQRSRP